MRILHALLVGAALLLSACTTPAQVASRDDSAGLSQQFQAPYAEVVQAANTALLNQKLVVKDTTTGPNETSIQFSKPVSAFSWGESGRVLVKRLSDTSSQVFVTSAANVAINVTAKSESSFARDIFAEMMRVLQGS